MKKRISFLLVIILLASSIQSIADEYTKIVLSDQKGAFFDLPASHFAHEAVNELNKKGIITGFSDGSFKPNNLVLRKDFAVLMVRALKLNHAETESSFSDIVSSNFYAKYIEAVKPFFTGFKKGSDLRFFPDNHTEREDAAVALVKAKKIPISRTFGEFLSSFKDEDKISSELKAYMATAVSNGVLNGYKLDNALYIRPRKKLTRAEAAVIIHRIIEEDLNDDSKNEELEDEKEKKDKNTTKDDTAKNEKINEDTKKEEDKKETKEEKPREKVSEDKEDKIEEKEKKVSKKRKVLKPKVWHEIVNSQNLIKWENFTSFRMDKLVITVSDTNKDPVYPKNGFLYHSSEPNLDYLVVYEGQTNRINLSESNKLEKGKKYYLKISVFYNDGEYIESDVLEFTIQ